MPSHAYSEDIDILQRSLATLPVSWEGREAVLQLKDANYHWKQMEWLGFYFEWLARARLQGEFQIQGVDMVR
ncbi:MAG: hypothetical protein U0031_00080 [Thermomicrobiales bacterium]